jgi:hypothetical protein
MLPEGHSAGAPTNDAASSLIEEITRMGRDNGRYQQAVAELRRIVAVLDAE